MSQKSPSEPSSHAATTSMLRSVGLRPTQQRLALASLLFKGNGRHVTAESLYEEASANGIKVSLATVYNTLNQFKDAGLLRELVIDSGKSYFDTNPEPHHHAYDELTGEISDLELDVDEQQLCGAMELPPGKDVSGVDIVVRLRDHGQ
ncbi:iron response transcriptional regulator IrrA [Halorhodospira halochloris]|uniref:iron response transcriptional regulator IrrA n=1 Tax=Halorhodospira halochloris TaxID=1052 RepID=UPI001EE922A8|nr:Fur family transcriptional regulator [Halorhodospira halochloris]MCG5547379.1 transcriptional repressor [Halorhodospira halochloris]